MYTINEVKVDRVEIANKILVRLEMEYKYAVNKNVDKPNMIKFLAEQLSRLSDIAVLGWNQALNNISDMNLSHPPTIPTIIEELKKVEIQTHNTRPKIEKKSGDTVYGLCARDWDAAKTDEQKREFFRNLNKRHLSQATRWVIREWLRGRGVDENKIKKMLYI